MLFVKGLSNSELFSTQNRDSFDIKINIYFGKLPLNTRIFGRFFGGLGGVIMILEQIKCIFVLTEQGKIMCKINITVPLNIFLKPFLYVRPYGYIGL